MTKLSVIIPVYNTELYLDRCIKSVLDQDISNIEIILVNDGSTDRSGEICDEYSKKFNNIKAFHKTNEGPAAARNKGLKLSTGDYIAYLDSDDFVTKNSYRIMMDTAAENQLDIVMANVKKYYNENAIESKFGKSILKERLIYKGLDALILSLKNESFFVGPTLGLYNRKFLIENNLFFKKSLVHHEDELWAPQIFLAADRIQYLDIDYYMHYQREGSLTHRKDMTGNALDLIKISYELNEVFKNLNINDSNKKVLLNHTVSIYLSAYNLGKLYRSELNFNKNMQFLIKNSYTSKNCLKTLLLGLNGKLYCKVNHLFKG